MAKRFENLAYTVYDSTGYFYIRRETAPRVFQKFNRTCPSPRILLVKQEDIYAFSSYSPDELNAIFADQKIVQSEIDSEVAKINESVTKELYEAKIPSKISDQQPDREVPTNIFGELNGYKFRRGWRYWVVEGITTLETAKRIYEATKQMGVRAHGDAGNPEPTGMVECYHIDTQQGLNEFARIICAK